MFIPEASTEIIIKALRILSAEIYSEDGVANAAIGEAADRLEKLNNIIIKIKNSADMSPSTFEILNSFSDNRQ